MSESLRFARNASANPALPDVMRGRMTEWVMLDRRHGSCPTTISGLDEMTSSAYPIPSPSPSPTFLYSPTKPPRNQPNAHPYAIKTTSTALLSRSTSSSTMSTASVHHYVPTSPSPTAESPTSPVQHHRPSRHRYSRSLTSDLPAPLPPPPQAQAQIYGHGHSQSTPGGYGRNFFGGGNDDLEDDTPRRRMHRAETMPPGSGLPFPSSAAGAIHPDLPEDSKAWTPTQLGVYLASSENQASSDVVAYIQEKQISGRAFMRLAETDLGSLSPPQRASLLAASRALRQRVMRGRIFGAGSGSEHGHAQGTSPFIDEPEEERTLGLNTANITRRNGIHIRPRRRSRHSSLASDSSDASTGSSFSSNASAASSGRVRGMVDEFESRFEEEGTGDTSYSGHSAMEERRGSPVKKRVEHHRHGAQAASPTPTKVEAGQYQHGHSHSHRLPQRAAVTDLFGFGSGSPAPAPVSTSPFPPGVETQGEGEEKDETITGLARKNVNGREARLLPFPPSMPSNGHQGQGWITPVHTGAQYALPSSPDAFLSLSSAQAYIAHGPLGPTHPHNHSQHAAYAHSYRQPPLGVGDYELGFRNAASPSNIPAATSSPRPADPHSQTYIVQHNPSPPTSANGDGGGSLTAKGHNLNGKGTKGQRLLPYPPVVGQSVLHHPRPRRVIGVGGGGGGAKGEQDGLTPGVEADEESAAGSEGDGGGWIPGRGREIVRDGAETTTETETEGGEDAWETANEGPWSTSAAESDADADADGENEVENEEPTMEDLLRGQPQGTGAPISGVEAWEMELGETVKRISASASASASAASSSSSVHIQSDQSHFGTNGKHTGASARDAPEIGRKAGRSGGTNKDKGRGSVAAGTGREKDKFGTRRGGIMGLFEPPPAEAVDDVKELKEDVEAEAEEEEAPPVPEKDTDAPIDNDADVSASAREALLDARDSELAQREKALAGREVALLSREADVEESLRTIQDREASLASREASLETSLSDRARVLDARETELTSRESELTQREEAIRTREEALKAREDLVRERERKVGERQGAIERERVRVFEEKAEVERRVREVEERERDLAVARAEAEAEALAGSRAEAAKYKAIGGGGGDEESEMEMEMEDLNPTRPKPYLASPWSIKRDYLLGRFMGLFPFPYVLFSSRSSTTTPRNATGNSSPDGNGDANANTRRRGSILSLLNLKGLSALAGQGGGYVVLMSLGVCAVVLRVLGRRLLGAVGGAGAGVGRR